MIFFPHSFLFCIVGPCMSCLWNYQLLFSWPCCMYVGISFQECTFVVLGGWLIHLDALPVLGLQLLRLNSQIVLIIATIEGIFLQFGNQFLIPLSLSWCLWRNTDVCVCSTEVKAHNYVKCSSKTSSLHFFFIFQRSAVLINLPASASNKICSLS